MNRRSHEGRLDDDALLQGLREVCPLEARESGPQPDVAGRCVLRLQATDLLQRYRDTHVVSRQQELSLEQGSTQCTLVEDW